MISKALKTAVKLCGLNLGFEAKDVSDQSLHAAGAMPLLCASVDSNIIKIISSWKNN